MLFDKSFKSLHVSKSMLLCNELCKISFTIGRFMVMEKPNVLTLMPTYMCFRRNIRISLLRSWDRGIFTNEVKQGYSMLFQESSYLSWIWPLVVTYFSFVHICIWTESHHSIPSLPLSFTQYSIQIYSNVIQDLYFVFPTGCSYYGKVQAFL